MTDINTAPETPPSAERSPCGLGRRFLIMIYDLLPAIACVFIAAIIALPLTGDAVRFGTNPLYTLYVLGAWFLYLGLCWTRSGQTLGMRAWQVEIVDGSGRRPGWGASLIRFGGSLLSALPLGLGYWVSLFREDRSCWHDRLSGTRLQRRPRPGAPGVR
jgi:uncharacterized RDD family membrane protein YckC